MSPAGNAIGFVYLSAFCSLYIQFRGLYGLNGIVPIHDYMNSISKQIDHSESILNNLVQYPTLLRLASDLGVSTDAWCEFTLILGILISSLICVGVHKPIFFLTPWLLYLSWFHAGQVFVNFQWDMLLLEVGFLFALSSCLSFFGAKLQQFNWCFRFVAWKFMFMAGVVKLQSECPTWKLLTALEV
jgi:hypothetical protein